LETVLIDTPARLATSCIVATMRTPFSALGDVVEKRRHRDLDAIGETG
jgi:hypothetical protein